MYCFVLVLSLSVRSWWWCGSARPRGQSRDDREWPPEGHHRSRTDPSGDGQHEGTTGPATALADIH